MICHLCELPLDQAVTVGTTARHGEAVWNVACARCGLVQVSPLPSEGDLADYYATEYRRLYRPMPVGGHEPGTAEYEAALDAGAEAYADLLVEQLSLGPASRVLEVGCGDGRLSAALGRRVGAVLACELDVDERLKAWSRDVDVRWPSLAQAVESGETFDAVISSHVLEHLREPIAALEAMASVLTVDGVIWAEVPNVRHPYGDLATHYWQRAHLYSFSPETAALTALRAGLTGIRSTAEQDHGRVLFLTARNPEARAARTYAEAVQLLGGEPQDGATVAAALEAYQRARDANAGRRLGEFMTSTGEADRWLRDEVQRMADALGSTMHALGKLAQDLDEYGARDSTTDDEWGRAYECGERAMSQRVNVVVSHIANQLVTRSVS